MKSSQAARALAILRRAITPSPQKPKIIIAQVDGSGTAAVKLKVPD
jgi:hypothetical protein